MFEYACHEANDSMANSLRGMRAKEKEDEAAAGRYRADAVRATSPPAM
jgi:hypothetical protein